MQLRLLHERDSSILKRGPVIPLHSIALLIQGPVPVWSNSLGLLSQNQTAPFLVSLSLHTFATENHHNGMAVSGHRSVSVSYSRFKIPVQKFSFVWYVPKSVLAYFLISIHSTESTNNPYSFRNIF
jgi:hypothetical protein